jgi:hypothetical protein
MTLNHRQTGPVAAIAASLVLIAGCGGGSSGESGPEVAQDPPTTLTTAPDGTSFITPAKNTLFLCPTSGLKPTMTASATPWVSGSTIDISKMAFVQGSVTWDSQFSVTMTSAGRNFVGNGLPNHPTGQYPVQEGTDAYTYYSALPAMGYTNAAAIPVGPYDLNVTVPTNPTPNAHPSCVQWIPTGVVTQTGAVWHAEVAFDQSFNVHDPVAALPPDQCWGHPYNLQYHYHAYSWKCFPDQGEAGQHSPLFGYAMDGFGVYGPRGENGELVTNDDLDECHGHTHEIDWDGVQVSMYHYHVNNQYPYSIGCYRGTPAMLPKNLQY